jgi:hypothetical protein
MLDGTPGHDRRVDDGPIRCSYELVRNGLIVSTGHLTLPRLPTVGDVLRLGGASVEVTDVLPGPRLHLVG